MPVRPTHSRTPTRNTDAADRTSPTRPRPASSTVESQAAGAGAVDSRESAQGTAAVLGGLARRTTAAARVSGTPLADGVAIDKGKLVVDGFRVAERASLRRSGGALLLSAASRIIGENGFGHSSSSIAKLSASARKALVAELVPLLEGRSIGRASLGDVRARSGAFSLLTESLYAMKGSGEARAAQQLLSTLLAAAQREPHAGLRQHMERKLGDLPSRLLKGENGAASEAMRAKQSHERPLRKEWLKHAEPKAEQLNGQPPALKVLASVQDEFWKEELAEYRKRGFDVKLDPKPRGDHSVATATATKEINGVKIEIKLHEQDTEVLDAMAARDVDIVLYTGHANLGGVTKIALENAPERASGEKLIALFACRSKQNVDSLDRKFPGQHLLVSDQGTYGHDDRIVLHQLLEGICRDKTYAQIEMAAKREGLWESKNYFFPNESVTLVGLDAVYLPDSKTAQGTSVSMRPKVTSVPRAADCNDAAVDDAVAWVNTVHTYWAEEFGTRADKQMRDHIVSKGWFDGDPKDGPVRVKQQGDVVEVSVNAAWAHQDPDALAMIVSFEAGRQLAQLGDPRRTEHEQRMLGLGMMAEYVYYLVEYSDVADILLRNFAKELEFPPGLSWPVVEKAVNSDPKHDCSPKALAALERGMEHAFLEVNPARTSSEFRRYVGAALRELDKRDAKIAKLTRDAIASGRVVVDELDDLTKKDYERIRRDYLKDGVSLPVDGHRMLDDHNSKAWRAITTDMNGYAWDNRIYVAPGLKPEALAATLVHEVNHFLNASEEHYRGPKQVLLEEYRAFYAEALFRGERMTKERCRKIKEGVINDYNLKGVTVDDVPDIPPGIIDT